MKYQDVILLAGMLLPGLAQADGQDVLSFYYNAGYVHDSNLFRLSDSADTEALLGHDSRADNMTSQTLGVKVDKPYGQQEFKLNASYTRNRFETYDFLNYDGRDYSAEWDWHLTPYISGTLLSSRKQTFNGFANDRTYSKSNVATVERQHLDLDVWVAANMHVVGGAERIKSTNDRGDYQVDNSTRENVFIGLRYARSPDRTLSFRAYQTTGKTPQNTLVYVADKFRQSDYELQLDYRFTGKLRMTARADYLKREYDDVPERDYRGWTGNMKWVWAQSGKLNWNLEASRYIGPNLTNYYSSATTDKLSFGPTWTPTAKQSIDLRAYRTHYRIGGALPGFPESMLEDDTILGYSLGWGWQPTQNLTLNASASREQRDSNLPGYDYQDTTGSVSLVWQFF